MNTSLPQSIEAYLKEAGFTQTEMLILRKLLEHNSLTIRELATKMGKSTGLIDQAMKKLMNKQIIKRESINGHPVYQIHSLDAVVQWVKTDMKGRKETLEKRQENFETFIATLKVDKHRPDMEHFSGEEGVQKAYDKLLEVGGEILTMMPVLYLAEDDPLRAFRVDLFRRRQVRKIFQRVLAPDSPLARRFQSRDMFEYRKTLLVPESQLPLTFEKTIAGGTVAYIDQKNLNACFLNFPEIAKTERATFDALWNRTLSDEKNGNGPMSAAVAPTVVPLSTRIFSRLREFFLGKRSIVALIIFAILSGMLTFGLYKTNRDLNLERLKEKVMSIASTGALQFDASDINAVWKPEDITKPQYAKLVATLNLIRRSNTDIQYAYVMRKTDDPTKLAFVADADSLFPNEKKDLNGDGKIDDADALSFPGELYSDKPPFVGDAFSHPVVTMGADQWGSFVSGAAPILDASGKPVALLGVDIFSSNLDRLSADSFKPLYAFIGFFALFMLIRFWSENRSLMEECLEEMKKNIKVILSWFIFLMLISGMITFGLSIHNRNLNIQRMKDKVASIAVTGALQFNPEDVENLRAEDDWKKPEWKRVVGLLHKIREQNDSIIFAYIIRKTAADPTKMEFVSDSYSFNPYANTDADPENNIDVNQNGIIDGPDVLQWPGQKYETAPIEAFEAYEGSKITTNFYEDQWGEVLTGYAPILDIYGDAIALLAIDMDASTLDRLDSQSFMPLYTFFGLLILLILIRIISNNGLFFRLPMRK